MLNFLWKYFHFLDDLRNQELNNMIRYPMNNRLSKNLKTLCCLNFFETKRLHHIHKIKHKYDF